MLSLLTLTLSLSSQPIISQNLPYPANSSVFTGEPPALVSADTPDTTIGWPRPHYYFTFNVPNSTQPGVAQVIVTPNPSGDPIAFDLQKTSAFQGNRRNRGENIPIQSVNQDAKTQEISIAFATPIAPGSTFTVSLQPYNNPGEAGTYIFSVQVLPAGSNPIAFDVGIGRFSFYPPFP
jgi:hypothetical protein